MRENGRKGRKREGREEKGKKEKEKGGKGRQMEDERKAKEVNEGGD